MEELHFPTPFNPSDTALLAKLRARAKSDKLWLSQHVLGYDFCESVHQELFDTFINYDPSVSWAEQDEITKRLTLWSRGHFKTSAVVVDIIQCILNFPDARVLIMQGSLKTTKNLLKEIASHFLGRSPRSRLTELFPDYCGVKDPKTGERKITTKTIALTAESFTTPARKRTHLQQATVTVASPRSVKTGQHYDIGYFDDLVNDQNYRSPHLLQKVEDDYSLCLPLLDPPFYVVMTGTRYAHEDLYAHIIRAEKGKPEAEREWYISIRTCWREDKSVRFPQQKTTDGRLIGFTQEMLFAIRDKDPAMYASQYLLQPASTADQLFTEEKVDACLINPAKIQPDSLSSVYMFVDHAVGSHGSRDDAVILLGKTDGLGNMYVTYGRGGKWSTSDLAAQILDICFKVERPVAILFEPSAAGKVFVEHLRLICQTRSVSLPLDFLEANSKQDAKYIRIQSLDSYMRQSRLFFFHGLQCWDKMKDQFTKWTGDKYEHDDYIDTVALMVEYFAARVPVRIPLSREKYPFLKFIDMGTDVTNPITQEPEQREDENGMGDFFSY
jgi:hypothetical protein